ncbi:zinc finger transcription factor [Scheffersomyces stipitis CBS 6054]|uniref:Glucose starvation modulator protein 1 n=1 Tax=Scheffersomyces stipitis (strain ATCC 58785 / CBS 6054 / NBRC 10063 / NRRL Y-11545) TaxID=322104 RepID=GSM1_PICST|nr:zinc finger transcription factor [Scheffersomyces stipitis CBS 6054]A3LWY2.2 RecName: Full=Glucose starvation modulator protein 1 [Scheffersomyces stipitis CBS 6054]ABN67713.2 zinc finger transcription factor [Scheffersomyces stipitis CBS 6054]
MTKRLSPHEKKNRKPASRACVFCHEKHLQCSNERPCKNCVKRGLAHECRDVIRKRAKYLNTNSRRGSEAQAHADYPHNPIDGFMSPTIKPEIPSPASNMVVSPQFVGNALLQQEVQHPQQFHPQQQQKLSLHNSMLNTTNDVLNRLLEEQNFKDTDSDNMSANSVNASRPNTAIGTGTFSSNYLNEEYLMLGDIILHSKPTSPSPSNTSVSEYNTNTVSPNFSSQINYDDLNQPRRKVLQRLKDSRPFISLGFSNESSQLPNLNSSNIAQSSSIPTEYVSPLVTHHLYQSVQDIYTNNIMNFDYPQSYHSLTHFLKKRFSGNNLPAEQKQAKRQSLLVILKLIASYRPTFISAHKSLLKPYDLQFLEMTFQRCLIDYEKLSQLNSSPTIIWRRTGEIVSITDDLLSLLGYNLADLLSHRTFIMELMYDDESITNYFRLFKTVAVGNLHSSIITKIKLTKNQNRNVSDQTGTRRLSYELSERDHIEFCSVWTVKRDMFDLPMMIIGQFLPILPAGDGVRMY